MSADDLTRRARETAARSHRTRPALADLLAELADEVDRLRDVAAREVAAHETHVARLTSERDAARAALERVRAVLSDPHATPRLLYFRVTRALEGES